MIGLATNDIPIHSNDIDHVIPLVQCYLEYVRFDRQRRLSVIAYHAVVPAPSARGDEKFQGTDGIRDGGRNHPSILPSLVA
jgi:hypothetical protein